MTGPDPSTDRLPLPAAPRTQLGSGQQGQGQRGQSGRRGQSGQLPQVLQNWLRQNGAQLPTLPDLTLDPTTRTA
jgi:hypothetical protein